MAAKENIFSSREDVMTWQWQHVAWRTIAILIRPRALYSAFVSCVLLSATVHAADVNYKILDRIKMPDGGFDYATFDPANGRVYMARSKATDVIDIKTGKVSELNSTGNGHLAVPVPGTTLVVLPLGQESVARIVDTATDKVVADLPTGEGTDAATYDPFSKFVFVMNRVSGTATVVDPVARKVVATIPVGGRLQFPASDGAGRLFVNSGEAPDVGVIDLKALQVTAHYPLPDCKDPSGLAYIAKLKLLVSACGNGVAKVLDSETGKDIASIPIGGGPDAVIYDAARDLAFIPCGINGVLEVISIPDREHIAVVQHLSTSIGTRTGTIDPQTGKLYLLAFTTDTTKVDRRVVPLDGTFNALVVGP
jgi:YVTN family beta-propeller protein